MVVVEAQGVFGLEKVEVHTKTAALVSKLTVDNQRHIANSQASLLRLINQMIEQEEAKKAKGAEKSG